MTFEEYLTGKKIDLKSFQKAEPMLFENWRTEFIQLHPNSFSAQKLYLINPVRRKYPLKTVAPVETKTDVIVTGTVTESSDPKTETQTPKPARPVFKPKPKIS